MKIAEQEHVAQATCHAQTAFLRQRADDQPADERDQPNAWLAPGPDCEKWINAGAAISSASTATIKPGSTKPSPFSPYTRGRAKSLFEEEDARADARRKAQKSRDRGHVAAAEADDHAQRAAEEGERTTITIMPAQNAGQARSPARARNSRPASAASIAPSTSPAISGRRYCTFSALCSPRPPQCRAGSRRYRSHVGGVARRGEDKRRETDDHAGTDH